MDSPEAVQICPMVKGVAELPGRHLIYASVDKEPPKLFVVEAFQDEPYGAAADGKCVCEADGRCGLLVQIAGMSFLRRSYSEYEEHPCGTWTAVTEARSLMDGDEVNTAKSSLIKLDEGGIPIQKIIDTQDSQIEEEGTMIFRPKEIYSQYAPNLVVLADESLVLVRDMLGEIPVSVPIGCLIILKGLVNSRHEDKVVMGEKKSIKRQPKKPITETTKHYFLGLTEVSVFDVIWQITVNHIKRQFQL